MTSKQEALSKDGYCSSKSAKFLNFELLEEMAYDADHIFNILDSSLLPSLFDKSYFRWMCDGVHLEATILAKKINGQTSKFARK